MPSRRPRPHAAAREIQLRLNPHPAGQMELNVPSLDGDPLRGMQHKYRETVLFFPSAGQTCHAYCSYCFRWPQFVGLDGLKFASNEASTMFELTPTVDQRRPCPSSLSMITRVTASGASMSKGPVCRPVTQLTGQRTRSPRSMFQ